jgi:hypothetical protein
MANCPQIDNKTIIGTDAIIYGSTPLPCTGTAICDGLNTILKKFDTIICSATADVNTLTEDITNITEELMIITEEIININEQVYLCCAVCDFTGSANQLPTPTTTTTSTTINCVSYNLTASVKDLNWSGLACITNTPVGGKVANPGVTNTGCIINGSLNIDSGITSTVSDVCFTPSCNDYILEGNAPSGGTWNAYDCNGNYVSGSLTAGQTVQSGCIIPQSLHRAGVTIKQNLGPCGTTTTTTSSSTSTSTSTTTSTTTTATPSTTTTTTTICESYMMTALDSTPVRFNYTPCGFPATSITLSNSSITVCCKGTPTTTDSGDHSDITNEGDC